MGVDLRVKNSHSQMIIISILFWKIKYTWAKFLKAVVFGDVSNFEREETVQECELHFSQYIFLGFFFFFVFYYVLWFFPRVLPILVGWENVLAFCHLSRGIKWQKKLLICEVLTVLS